MIDVLFSHINCFQAIPSGKWNGPGYKIWSDNECNNLLNFLGTLDDCKNKCKNIPGCTAFNFNQKQPLQCTLRGCPSPVPEAQTSYEEYVGYFLQGMILACAGIKCIEYYFKNNKFYSQCYFRYFSLKYFVTILLLIAI